MKKRYSTPILLVSLLALFLFGCKQPVEGKTQSDQKERAHSGVIVAVGDSLTAGFGVEPDDSYPSQLQSLLNARGIPWKVINSGVSGETSSGTLSRINWILSMKPDIVVLETGANDGLRGIDPNLTRHNILKIVGELQKKRSSQSLQGCGWSATSAPTTPQHFINSIWT